MPTVAGLAHWRWAHGEQAALLFDATLALGRRFAAAGRAAGGQVLALEGDAIRLARRVLAKRPALVAGISRHTDALPFEEAAAEHGYARLAALAGDASRCTTSDCRPGWQALGRIAHDAGDGWPAVLARFVTQAGPDGSDTRTGAGDGPSDPHRAFGWLLAPTMRQS